MRHIAYIDCKPELSGRSSTPDGAITGNGDLAVILGNAPDGIRLFIAKNDLWYGVERYDSGGMKPLGYIDIPVETECYERYHAEQDMDTGEIRCHFAYNDKNYSFTVKVLKTENAIVIRNSGNMPLAPVLRVFGGETAGRKGSFEKDGVTGIFRSFDGDDCVFETHVFSALKKIEDGLFYCFVATNHDTENPEQAVADKINAVTGKNIAVKEREHALAWQRMWEKSSFSCSDSDLERGWYASQYFLAVCAGNTKFPPGIFGNFITVEYPGWHNDFHLNYNYQAPFYAACSSNHPEFTDCYMAPLEEFTEKGEAFAAKMGCRGVVYPVGIGPKGICTEMNKKLTYWFDRLFLGQKSNAIHPADIPVFRWNATRDTEYARLHAYPYVKRCLAFFEDYCEKKDGRYYVCGDAAHEVPIYRDDYRPEKYKRYLNDTNNALTLGMLRLCLPAAIDMAKALGVDEDKQKKWQEMLDKLSPFATYLRWGKRVFRYTEKGQMWNDGGDVGMQHIYPGGAVGLSSSASKLHIARNTFKMKSKYCFDDDNAVSSFFPMAARLGISPQLITRQLRELNYRRRLPNFLYLFGGGCLEDCSIPACTLNEMVLQSHQNVIRLFPDWDENLSCSFRNLRADGAVLVSSSFEKGKYGETELICEKGGTVAVILPFDGARLTHNEQEKYIIGNSFSLETKPGDRIRIQSV